MLHRIKTFLPYRMKRQVRELFVATTITNLALAMVMIFEPIYLYDIGYSLQMIMLFYLMAYILYFVIMPLGGKFATEKGYEIGIAMGVFLYIAFYVSLFLIQFYPWLFYMSAIILALQKMFYWPAYHADFAKNSEDTEEGREISAITVSASLVYIIGPALAGLIIKFWGFGALFVATSIIFLISNIPILITRERFKPHGFGYLQSYKNLFSKANRRAFWAYIGFGEELVVLVIWPIFMAVVIADALDLGMIVALATLITTMLVFYIGKLSDLKNKRKILALSSAFYSLTWFIRLFISNIFGVFFVDTLSRLGKNTLGVPLTAITYENAKNLRSDGQHSIMHTVVFFEMSLVVGKLIAMILIFVALFFVGSELLAFNLSFILAGGMTLLYLLL